MTLVELGRELENLTGRTIKDTTSDIKRVIAHLLTLNQIQIHL